MRLLFSLALLVSTSLQAGVIVSFKVTGTGGAPIPVAYSLSDAKSKVVTGLLQSAEEVCVYNGTDSIIAVYLDNKATSGTAPTADLKDVYVPAVSGFCTKTRLNATVLIRSATGSTITAGTVYGSVISGSVP